MSTRERHVVANLEPVINTGLLHDAIGGMTGFTICRNGLVSQAVTPDLV